MTNATLPYILELANRGAERVIQVKSYMRRALNLWDGNVVIK